MSLRFGFFVLLLLVVAGGAILVFQPGLVGLGARSSSTTAANDQRGLNFVQSVNDLGDRIFLTASVSITLTPQPTGPDKVTIRPAGSGGRPGTFRFTITPHQGSRGVRRAAGEFDTGGQVFRLCEVVDDPAGALPVRAERYTPVNNVGDRFALPTPMPATIFAALITAAVSGTRPGSNSTSFSPTPETARLAETLVGLCQG